MFFSIGPDKDLVSFLIRKTQLNTTKGQLVSISPPERPPEAEQCKDSEKRRFFHQNLHLAVLRSFAKGLTFSGFNGKSLLNQRG